MIMAIETLESLREHLQWAIALEHATLPPYLCALYSIKGNNEEAAEVLRSVFMEEMLHMTPAANILNAVGGEPEVDAPWMLPSHPDAVLRRSRTAGHRRGLLRGKREDHRGPRARLGHGRTR
jgi:hypothetical protein